jgi:hypothetical protein
MNSFEAYKDKYEKKKEQMTKKKRKWMGDHYLSRASQ